MLTYKLKIKNKIDVSQCCRQYSFMFRKLFSNFELSKDKGFQKELRTKFGLDSWFFESCRMEVETKLSQQETFLKKREKELESLSESIGYISSRRNKYYTFKRIKRLEPQKENGITFGSKSALRKISFLSNKTNKQSQIELLKWKAEYAKKRILPICSVGEAPQKSNRKFIFDFEKKKVVFKPKKSTKIDVEFYCSAGQHNQLIRLQEMVGIQAITVKIDNDYLWITFDEEKLNGYAFDKNSWSRELRKIPKEEKELRTNCTKFWHEEQRKRKLIGKIENRILAVDLNPEHIGFCVLEDKNLLHKQVICLNKLNTKKGLSSTDKNQIHQNNKRKFEICQIWKRIFEAAKHYKVSKFAMEDLNFEYEVKSGGTEGNKKTKNLWHRELTEQLITKYCNINGIEKIEVNPCYSSFIGNIQQSFFDPLNAAIEIGRRGSKKYLKGGFYPELRRIDVDTMCQKFGLDVQHKNMQTWVEYFKLFKTSGLRYRRRLDEFPNLSEINLKSHKSHTYLYDFR